MQSVSINLRRAIAALAALCASVVLVAAPASATWSIVGVDPDTGDVGVAVASCVPGYALGNLDEPLDVVALAPGKGAGVSQAAVNNSVPPEMIRLLNGGSTADEVIAAVSAATFDNQAEMRQHGVVTVDGGAFGFSGADNDAVALDRQSANVSAQGNILVSEQVITDALDAFAADATADLATRLVNALEAGSLAGGDSRCPDQTALFAHVVVATPSDDGNAPSVHLIATVDEGSGENPVELLAEQFRAGTTQGHVLNATDSFPVLIPLIGAGVLFFCVVGFFLIRRTRRRRTS